MPISFADIVDTVHKVLWFPQSVDVSPHVYFFTIREANCISFGTFGIVPLIVALNWMGRVYLQE